MIPINYVLSSFTGDIFHDLITNLTPWIRNTCPLDAILILHRMFIRLEKCLLGNLAKWFLFLAPGESKWETCNLVDELRCELYG